MVRTDLLLDTMAPERANRARIVEVLADDVATVAPWVVERVLANTRSAQRIAWLTAPKVAWRLASLWDRAE